MTFFHFLKEQNPQIWTTPNVRRKWEQDPFFHFHLLLKKWVHRGQIKWNFTKHSLLMQLHMKLTQMRAGLSLSQHPQVDRVQEMKKWKTSQEMKNFCNLWAEFVLFPVLHLAISIKPLEQGKNKWNYPITYQQILGKCWDCWIIYMALTAVLILESFVVKSEHKSLSVSWQVFIFPLLSS